MKEMIGYLAFGVIAVIAIGAMMELNGLVLHHEQARVAIIKLGVVK